MSTGKPAAPKLLLVQTGGTIDKEYPATQGGYAFDIGEAAALAIVSRCAPTIPTECMTACRKDSSELNAEDRAQIVAKIKAHPAKRVLVTHGTDTMIETAHAIGEQRMPKTIVLTGSFRPAAFSVSDAEFNTGGAVAALGMLGNGVYIAMNGLVLSYDKVSRDAATGYFIRTPGGAAAAAGGKAAAQAATAEGRSAAAKPFVPGPAAKRGQQKGGGGGGGNRKIAASGAAGGGGGGGHEMPEGSLKGLQGAMVWYDETKNYGAC